MVYPDPVSGVVVLLNGEIYNYDDLWQEVSRTGQHAEKELEAELIARLYQIYGLGFAKRLKGMFALVIIDGSRLSSRERDRFGIKPLYYAKCDTSILVCSEIKGLLAHPKMSPVLNVDALEETRVFGYVHSQDETLFQGIKQVLPGTVMSFDSDGVAVQERFWDIASGPFLERISRIRLSGSRTGDKKPYR